MAINKPTTIDDLKGKGANQVGPGVIGVHRDEPTISPELEKIRDEQAKREGDPVIVIKRDDPTISLELKKARDEEIAKATGKTK